MKIGVFVGLGVENVSIQARWHAKHSVLETFTPALVTVCFMPTFQSLPNPPQIFDASQNEHNLVQFLSQLTLSPSEYAYRQHRYRHRNGATTIIVFIARKTEITNLCQIVLIHSTKSDGRHAAFVKGFVTNLTLCITFRLAVGFMILFAWGADASLRTNRLQVNAQKLGISSIITN